MGRMQRCFSQPLLHQLQIKPPHDKIYGFQQRAGESFHKAWERYNEYIRNCPHHSFTEICILNTFYKGTEWTFKTTLDSASNGNFMTKTVEEAYVLIDNLAARSNNNCLDQDRTSCSTTSDSKQITELKEPMNLLLKISNVLSKFVKLLSIQVHRSIKNLMHIILIINRKVHDKSTSSCLFKLLQIQPLHLKITSSSL